MSTAFKHPGFLAAIACAAALATGPAAAQSAALERVEVQGRVVEAPARYDVHAACADLEGQLHNALARTGFEQDRYGEVTVQFVLESGGIRAVDAKGISNSFARKVRSAVNRLDCARQTTASAEIYRFTVDFIDPKAPAPDTRVAGTPGAGERRVRISG